MAYIGAPSFCVFIPHLLYKYHFNVIIFLWVFYLFILFTEGGNKWHNKNKRMANAGKTGNGDKREVTNKKEDR